MARFLKNRSNLIGKAPGTVVFIGKKKMEQARFRLIQYNKQSIEAFESRELGHLMNLIDKNKISWLNIDGVHDQKVIEQLSTFMELSPLQTENIANTDQRPKALEYNGKWVIHLKTLSYKSELKKISSDQITLVMSSHLLITFQENVANLFDSIRERLQIEGGKLRTSGTDYLTYRIMDTLADNYMLCLSQLGDLIEQNETKILSRPNRELIEELYRYKIELSYIRKAIWPVKDMIRQLKASEVSLFKGDTIHYLNALENLISHSIETIDVYYGMISDQINIYNTNMMNRTNDVMKVLTIFSALFIPLTFITGIYGTNFDHLPELHLKYGYPAMWALMLIITLIMLLYFKRKRWF